MGRAPCCDKANVKKGPWSPEEDAKLKAYIQQNGTGGNWITLPKKIGLKRCGKSCRLRWLNYLRPNIKHGEFTEEEDNIICSLYITIGSRWSIIAAQLPGRTDNDIKNYWNTKLKKKLLGTKQPCKSADVLYSLPHQQTPPFPFPFPAHYSSEINHNSSSLTSTSNSFHSPADIQLYENPIAANALSSSASIFSSINNSQEFNTFPIELADELFYSYYLQSEELHKFGSYSMEMHNLEVYDFQQQMAPTNSILQGPNYLI